MKRRKINYYEKIYEGAWNQYCFLVSRSDKIDHKFEILLLVSGVFFAVFFTLKIWEINVINFISIFAFLVIYLCALFYVLPRSIYIPWIRRDSAKNEYEQYEQLKDVEGFYKQLIDETYTWEKDIRKGEKYKKRFLRIMMTSLLIATFIPLLTIAYDYLECLWLIFIFIIGISYIIIVYNLKFGKGL